MNLLNTLAHTYKNKLSRRTKNFLFLNLCALCFFYFSIHLLMRDSSDIENSPRYCGEIIGVEMRMNKMSRYGNSMEPAIILRNLSNEQRIVFNGAESLSNTSSWAKDKGSLCVNYLEHLFYKDQHFRLCDKHGSCLWNDQARERKYLNGKNSFMVPLGIFAMIISMLASYISYLVDIREHKNSQK